MASKLCLKACSLIWIRVLEMRLWHGKRVVYSSSWLSLSFFFFFFSSGEWGCMATVRSAMCAGALLGCSSASQQVFYGEKTARMSHPENSALPKIKRSLSGIISVCLCKLCVCMHVCLCMCCFFVVFFRCFHRLFMDYVLPPFGTNSLWEGKRIRRELLHIIFKKL